MAAAPAPISQSPKTSPKPDGGSCPMWRCRSRWASRWLAGPGQHPSARHRPWTDGGQACSGRHAFTASRRGRWITWSGPWPDRLSEEPGQPTAKREPRVRVACLRRPREDKRPCAGKPPASVPVFLVPEALPAATGCEKAWDPVPLPGSHHGRRLRIRAIADRMPRDPLHCGLDGRNLAICEAREGNTAAATHVPVRSLAALPLPLIKDRGNHPGAQA